MNHDPRQVLERLCHERGEDFAGLSRMLGRNAAYIQQFVRRGVPRRLKEEERRKLARYFSISEALLGGPAENVPGPSGLVSVDRHPVSVSAGPGAIVTEELGKPYFAFDGRWLKALTSAPSEQLSIVRVEGDSMSPTLNAGDGAVTSNMAIVPTTNGSVSAFATDSTHLLLDISAYFAP